MARGTWTTVFVVALLVSAVSAARDLQQANGESLGTGLPTGLPIGIPSIPQPVSSILPIPDGSSLPIPTNVINGLPVVSSILGPGGLGGLLNNLPLAVSTPQISNLAPVGVDLTNLLQPAVNPQPLSNTPKNGTFLYIWCAYGKTYTDPYITTQRDFLATADLTIGSPTYGNIIQVTPAPTVGNEPHHIGISYDRTKILGSGLLSFLKLQDDIFLFDIKDDPRTPKFVRTINPPRTAVSDHVLGIAPGLLPDIINGGFVTTQMGSDDGGSPGGLSIYDEDLNLVKQVPQDGPVQGAPDAAFDPHGETVDVKRNLLLTSDFVNPLSTVTSNVFQYPLLNQLANSDVTGLSGIITRDTVRVWDFKALELTHTIHLDGAQGVIDVKFIGDTGLAYATGVFNNALYVVDPVGPDGNGLATKVIQFPANSHPHLLSPNVDGTRFQLSLNKAGKVIHFDSTDPYHPKILDTLDLNAGTNTPSAPHYLTPLGPNDDRLAIADYFLDQGAIGAIHAGGNKRVIVLPIRNDKFVTAESIQFHFAQTPARPHGIASYTQYIDLAY